MLARYGDKILAVCQANAGMCAALDSGYRRATGDVISFLDADDVWLPGKLSAVVRELERRPAVGMVFHHVRTVDKDGAPVRAPWDRGLVANGDVADSMWLECLPWRFRHTSSVSLRRKIASLAFLLATRLRGHADDLIPGVAALLAQVSFLLEVLSLYRVHGDNIFAARFLEEYNNARGGQPAAGPARSASAKTKRGSRTRC